MNSLLTFSNWTPEQAQSLLELALDVKQQPQNYTHILSGKNVIGYFEKPSLRTRLSFDIGVQKLGGHFIYVDTASSKLSGREDAVDMAANMSCWADGIVARVFSHSTLETFVENASVPVVNALCDKYHPCQAIADYLSMYETFGTVKGKTLAYVGDGNNVTHSLLLLGALLGCHQVVVTPEGHEVDEDILAHARSLAVQTQTTITTSNDVDAAKGADIIYADTWLSMGDDTPLEKIKARFMPYQVNSAMIKLTGASHVMHCQPAHRDLEITSELIDGEKSLLMLQAENRMHAQNAVLTTLFA